MKLHGQEYQCTVLLSLDEPGEEEEEEEEGVTYLTLLGASQQTRAANHRTDKASLVSPW